MIALEPVPALLIAAALAGCVASGPRCARPDTRELRTVEKLIAETRAGIARGYRMEQDRSSASVNFCLGGASTNVGVAFCTDPSTRTRPVAIDLAAEQRKLKSLEARRDALQAAIDAETARCAAMGYS